MVLKNVLQQRTVVINKRKFDKSVAIKPLHFIHKTVGNNFENDILENRK